MTVDEKFHIVVEGGEDLLFMKGYLRFLEISFSDECFKSLGGWNKLDGYMPNIKEKRDKGVKVLIVFDANADREARLKEIHRLLGGVNPPVFLFPNDKSAGDLEDVLMEVIAPENRDIFACFEDYKKCLERSNPKYIHPDKKGKIYAYKEALGVQRTKRQFDSKYWNYDHPALNPLKDFITKRLGE